MWKNEQGNAFTIFLIVIIIILVLVLAVFFIKGKLSKNEEENQTNTQNENIITEKQIKLDKNKELAYNAEYKYKNLEGKSYTSETMEKTYSLKDIVVPFININSKDAEKVNKEIKENFEEMAQSFEEELNGEKTFYTTSSYKSYTNRSILSIVITTVHGGTAEPRYNYYTYNFDLDTLELLKFDDVYKKLGFTEKDIRSKAKDAILKCDLLTKLEDEQCPEGNKKPYIDKSIENYTTSVNEETIKFFINEDNQLNIIVKIEIPAGAGEFETMIKVFK